MMNNQAWNLQQITTLVQHHEDGRFEVQVPKWTVRRVQISTRKQQDAIAKHS